jgi:uncharacterized protein (TIGR00297 family)
LSSGIGLLAYRRHSLTRGGAAGAVATGTTIFGLGGWSWGLSLIYFFVSSTLLSHWRTRDKAHVAADKFSKGSQRDLAQVAANGGVAAGFALLTALLPTQAGSVPTDKDTNKPSLAAQTLEMGFLGAMATATADTWATELGVLSQRQPRLLTTGQPVAPGTSGGITFLGSTASALGALTLGLLYWCLQSPSRRWTPLPLLALLSGMAGSLSDSLFGATIQQMSFCPTCLVETERPIHSCGATTLPQRGLSWCNNDTVNLFATLVGSFTAIVLYGVFRLLACIAPDKQ